MTSETGRVHGLRSFAEPVTIAHRAGNDLSLVRQAEADGIDVVEADLWLHRGRLEVRHSKTLGPIPGRWDRWWINFRPGPSLELHELLNGSSPGTLLMLDLKGRHPELPWALRRLLETDYPDRSVLACSQNWRMLEQLRDVSNIELVYSIGNRRQLAASWKLLEADGYDAVSIHAQLLNVRTTAALHQRVQAIITWPINDHAELARVRDLGVTGVISDSWDLLREIEREKADADASA